MQKLNLQCMVSWRAIASVENFSTRPPPSLPTSPSDAPWKYSKRAETKNKVSISLKIWANVGSRGRVEIRSPASLTGVSRGPLFRGGPTSQPSPANFFYPDTSSSWRRNDDVSVVVWRKTDVCSELAELVRSCDCRRCDAETACSECSYFADWLNVLCIVSTVLTKCRTTSPLFIISPSAI